MNSNDSAHFFFSFFRLMWLYDIEMSIIRLTTLSWPFFFIVEGRRALAIKWPVFCLFFQIMLMHRLNRVLPIPTEAHFCYFQIGTGTQRSVAWTLQQSVRIQCGSNYLTAALPRNMAEALGVNGLFLNDRGCSGKRNATHWMVRTHVTSCGSTSRIDGKLTTYSNAVKLQTLQHVSVYPFRSCNYLIWFLCSTGSYPIAGCPATTERRWRFRRLWSGWISIICCPSGDHSNPVSFRAQFPCWIRWQVGWRQRHGTDLKNVAFCGIICWWSFCVEIYYV